LRPKKRIGRCHSKDVVNKPDHKYDWAPVGGGIEDWVGQLQALQRDGCHYGLSLETHWRGAGTPEASTRASMDGLKKALTKAGISC
jgi:sugar phosphate isomerase/epimerase